jgi:general secretion pathway protein C
MLVALLAVQLAQLSWQLLSPSQVPSGVMVSAAGAPQGGGYDLVVLQQAELMGGTAALPVKPSVAVVSSTQVRSRQNIRLLGLVHGSAGMQSVAVLLIDGKQGVFAVGDYLKDGGPQLLQITQDRVVIQVDGRQEYIELERSTRSASGLTSRAVATDQPLPSRISLQQSQLTRLVPNYREKLVSDPLSFGRFVQLRPQITAGRVSGYQLRPGRDKRLFEALGLQAGDVVTHVNQLDLAAPESLNKLMALVSQGGRIQVGIRRGGELVDVDVEL